MSNQERRVNIRITGFVQGVFFRAGVKAEAERLGLTGWVSNEPDGSVKIMAEGEEENLQKLMEWCRKGTEWARVEKVEVGYEKTRGKFSGFEVR